MPLIFLRQATTTLLQLIAGASLSLQLGATTIMRDDQAATVSLDPAFTARQQQQLLTWVDFALDALALVYGQWPQNRFALQVVRHGGGLAHGGAGDGGADPVPWAQVDRGPTDTVTLVVNTAFDAGDLRRDWTIYHELSHLLIPYNGIAPRWFAEGLASYYQNIIQARVGLLSERELWQKLFDGFERGRRDDRYAHYTLTQLSRRLGSTGAYMRLYWSGVRYWLEVDLRLRTNSSGKQSLDTALLALKHCCEGRRMSGADIARQLDAANGTELFGPLFQAYGRSRAIPDYRERLLGLGLSIHRHRVALSESDDSTLRQGIYRGSETMSAAATPRPH